jgi:hypothetical protein
MGKTERIGPQIVVDVSFNQNIAMRTRRFRKDAQRGQARPEPVHFISSKSPLRHRHSYRSTVTARAERQGLTLIARRGRRDSPQGTAAFELGGKAGSVIVPRKRSIASLSARSSFSSGGI